jgi:flavin-dependent dehydrogenase
MESNDFDFDIAILGAGPGGLSAAVRAAQRGLSHVLLEAAEQHANTIQQYQRRQHVMARLGAHRGRPTSCRAFFRRSRTENFATTWAPSKQ